MLHFHGAGSLTGLVRHHETMATPGANSTVAIWHVLDMTARLEFSTPASKSFSLERQSGSLCPNRQLGWVEIHHPCDGHIKARIRASLPQEYHQPEKMKQIVEVLFVQAGIPADETYEAHFVSPSAEVAINRPMDRNGYSDRI
jgi:hypothetical protein